MDREKYGIQVLRTHPEKKEELCPVHQQPDTHGLLARAELEEGWGRGLEEMDARTGRVRGRERDGGGCQCSLGMDVMSVDGVCTRLLVPTVLQVPKLGSNGPSREDVRARSNADTGDGQWTRPKTRSIHPIRSRPYPYQLAGAGFLQDVLRTTLKSGGPVVNGV